MIVQKKNQQNGKKPGKMKARNEKYMKMYPQCENIAEEEI